jgi:hypothetical protein
MAEEAVFLPEIDEERGRAENQLKVTQDMI